ncbi:MAG: hypothetical protein ABSE39_03770 [Candidatus Bathyarchaeia archaeon]
MDRIYRRIRKTTQANKPLTIKQLSSREHLSVDRVRNYIRLINERLQKRTKGLVSIQRVGMRKRFRYVYVETPPPERPIELTPQRGDVVVRAYLDYGVSEAKEIHIECIVVTPRDPRLPLLQDPRVIETVHGIRNYVAGNFGKSGKKIAAMLSFGFYQPTPLTRNQFHYKHRGGWMDF